MERKIYYDLLSWKKSPDRKPLILQGARQVGKTYIVNYFAGKEYSSSIYCNFEKDPGLHDLFRDLSPSSIIKKLSIYKRREILPENTLIILALISASTLAIAKWICRPPWAQGFPASVLPGASAGRKICASPAQPVSATMWRICPKCSAKCCRRFNTQIGV